MEYGSNVHVANKNNCSRLLNISNHIQSHFQTATPPHGMFAGGFTSPLLPGVVVAKNVTEKSKNYQICRCPNIVPARLGKLAKKTCTSRASNWLPAPLKSMRRAC